MTKKQLYEITLKYLEGKCPTQDTELFYESPFQILVAVVLSAQCTDKRVNMVTPKLFELYPTAALMSKATPQEIYQLINSVSYPNSKSKYLVDLSKRIKWAHILNKDEAKNYCNEFMEYLKKE